MKRAFIISIVLVVLLVAGALIGPSFVDWNKYKSQILAQLHDVTGHKYDVQGPLEMAVLPYPHLVINGLSVKTPTTSGEIDLVELEKASVQLALVPLFNGEIVVNSVVLQKPVFKLAVDKNGNQSWMTPKLKQRANSEAGGKGFSKDLANAVALNEIIIKNGSFSYNDLGSGKAVSFTDLNMTVRGDSLYGPYTVSGDMVYRGKKAEIELKSGRIDKLAESISTQLAVNFPELKSRLGYSGIVVYKDNIFVLQGETEINTPDPTSLSSVLMEQGDALPDYFKRPFSARGVLTFNDKEIAYRNMALGFGTLKGNGYLVLQNFKKGAPGPLDVNFVLETGEVYKIDDFLPAKSEVTAPSKTFIPPTITLPRSMTGAINVKSKNVQYAGVNLKDAAFSFSRKEQGVEGQASFKADGNTAVDVNGKLNFGSQSTSSADGSVTYSEPELVLENSITSENVSEFTSALSKASMSSAAATLLANKLVLNSVVKIKPDVLSFNESRLKLAENVFNVSGDYTKFSDGRRDLAKLSVGTIGLDADQWIGKLAAQNSEGVQAPASDPAGLLKAMSLPFDVEFKTDVQGLRYKGIDYTRMVVIGKLLNGGLVLESAQASSKSGDEFVLAGGVKDLSSLNGVDLTFQAKMPNPQDTLMAYGVEASRVPTSLGDAEFIADIKGKPEDLAFTVNVNAMRGSLEASGKLADSLKAPKISDLTLRLKHPNYVELVRIYNPRFHSGVAIKKTLDLYASMSRKDNVYSFSQLQANIGPAVLKGDVVADVSKAKPVVTAALEFTDLPLDDLLGIRTAATGNTNTTRTSPSGGTSDVRWSRNAINTGLLHKIDFALKATANKITYSNWVFNNAGMNIDLKNGNLDVKQLDGGLYGGHVALTGSVKTSAQERQPLSFAGNVLVQDVNLESFVQSFSGSRLVKAKGNMSMASEVKATGLSPAALIFDLSGKGTVNGNNLVFEGFDLARLSRALAEPSSSFTENFTRLLDASLKGGTTSFKTLDGAFDINEGVIKFSKLDLKGDAADVATLGTVSLPLWSMDLESTVTLSEPEDAPPLRASFKGPIDKPAQTFGQNAMQQYFRKQIEGTILSPLLDDVDSSGALKQMLGIQGPSKKAPVQQRQQSPAQDNGATTVNEDGAITDSLPEQQEESQSNVAPAPQQQKREMKPEEAIFGIIQGVLGGE